jgi:hypothetical protein
MLTNQSNLPTGELKAAQWPNRSGPHIIAEPVAMVAWLGAASSIGSLVLYLAGVAEFSLLLRCLLVPGALVLLGCLWQAHRRGNDALYQRIVSALWAGLIATLLYDLVRVPAMLAGMPVFKAISYFGTVMLNQPAPSFKSEFAGWAYHLSNGIGFGLMYALMVRRPTWWTAVLWGLTLESLMLLTPYAEIFGYSMSLQFLAITIGAHISYGLTLWAGLRFWSAGPARSASALRGAFLRAGPALIALFGIGAIAVDFYSRFAAAIPPSPPAYVGTHLYVTWDVLEPDRVASAWVWQRFVEPRARFHLVRPFSNPGRGIPFDVPEADVRRSATRSATENLLAARNLEQDAALSKVARMTHVFEITPWAPPAAPEASELGRRLLRAVELAGKQQPSAGLRAGFAFLDEWYARAATSHSEQHYVTHDKLEVDKLASIWLIQRFVSKEASFQFVRSDLPLPSGIPLDEPEAELRRDARNSCFENVMARFKAQAPGLDRFSRIIREIELNPWGQRQFPESVQLERAVKDILDAHPADPALCMKETGPVFDRLLETLAAKGPPPGS